MCHYSSGRGASKKGERSLPLHLQAMIRPERFRHQKGRIDPLQIDPAKGVATQC
jgi:hypothetical protein